MNPTRTWKILHKDLALGPRSPFFLFALLLPIALTLLLQSAFGALFAPPPRLALVDEGASEISAFLAHYEAIEVVRLPEADELRRRVEANDFDVGLILPQGFDDAVRDGQRPVLPLFVGGESYASDRFILQATVLAAVRALAGDISPAEVQQVILGEEGIPLSLRLVPVIVFYALVMAGVFVPGASLVQEKEQGTLTAMAVTPVRASEVLLSKWALGFFLASAMSAATLLLNGVMGTRPLEVALVLLVAAALTSMLGVLFGVLSKDSAAFFGLTKGVGLLLFAPVLFYLFPDWPQWIARIFPLYWIIEPVWHVSVMGEPIRAVWREIAVALAFTGGMVPVLVLLARRMNANPSR
jgi:ABC-2 type transport system permease protein